MISWNFWQALQRPPRTHHLYKRINHREAITTRFIDSALAVMTVVAVVIVLLSNSLASIISLVILVAVPLVALRFGLLFGLTGMANGLRWAVASGQALVTFRRDGLYDLLCLTPPGPLGINWAVSTGIFYRLLQAGRVRSNDLWAVRMYIILPLTFFLATRNGILLDRPFILLLNIILNLVLVVAWFQLEDTQSITLGGLIGMLIPTYTRNPLEVRVVALSLYTAIQFFIYSAVILLIVSLLPDMYQMLGLEGWLVGYSHLLLGLALIAALRELANQVLWRTLVQRLDLGSGVRIEKISGVY